MSLSKLSDEDLKKWVDATDKLYKGLGQQETGDINSMATELQRRRGHRFASGGTTTGWRTCVVCGDSILKGVINYSYMVFDTVWRSAGFSYGDMAHIGCLEQQLGRKLEKTDLTDCPLNQILHWILDQGLELPKH